MIMHLLYWLHILIDTNFSGKTYVFLKLGLIKCIYIWEINIDIAKIEIITASRIYHVSLRPQIYSTLLSFTTTQGWPWGTFSDILS